MINPLAKLLAITLSLTCTSAALAGTKVPVKLSFIEALDPKDTTSSKRFQDEYERATSKALELSRDRLTKCGYELSASHRFYGASDPLQAREAGATSVSERTWAIVGPRRSNHYLLIAQGAPDTPSISLMASSQEVFQLSPLHLTLAPSNDQMAQRLAKELRNASHPNASYYSIVNAECLNCKDFASSFETSATKLGLKRVGRTDVTGDAPGLQVIMGELKQLAPDFVLIPNYSILSSYLISEIHKQFPKIQFAGGDGWGNAKFGFVPNGLDLGNARGLSVRGQPPTEEGLKSTALGRQLLATKPDMELWGSSTTLGIFKAVDGVSHILCKAKPKSSTEFAKAFKSQGPKEFSSPWGVSVFSLSGQQLTYSHSRKPRL